MNGPERIGNGNTPARVRIATGEDWMQVRDLRIEAFRSHEYALAGNIANALESDEADWRDWCAGPQRAVFLLFQGEEAIGLGLVFTDRNDPSSAIFDAVYLKPSHRGRRLSRGLFEARFEWARAKGFQRVELSHWKSNTASGNACRAFGFREIRRAPHQARDGSQDEEIFYELQISRPNE